MICDGCKQRLQETSIDFLDAAPPHIQHFLICPNFQSAFMEFIQEAQVSREYDMLGEYPCERMYEIPLNWALV